MFRIVKTVPEASCEKTRREYWRLVSVREGLFWWKLVPEWLLVSTLEYAGSSLEPVSRPLEVWLATVVIRYIISMISS